MCRKEWKWCRWTRRRLPVSDPWELPSAGGFAGLAIRARMWQCSRREVTPSHPAASVLKQKSKLFMWFQANFCQFLFWQVLLLPWATPRTAFLIMFIASDFQLLVLAKEVENHAAPPSFILAWAQTSHSTFQEMPSPAGGKLSSGLPGPVLAGGACCPLFAGHPLVSLVSFGLTNPRWELGCFSQWKCGYLKRLKQWAML